MNRRYRIEEDTRPQRLPVWVVPQLVKQIKDIYGYNIKNNRNATVQWFQDIENIKKHISERVIGFQYQQSRKMHWKMPIYILGHNVSFSIKNNNGMAYICIYNMELNAENYGLINPYATSLQNNINGVSEDFERRLNRIITETLNRVIRESILAENRKRKVLG